MQSAASDLVPNQQTSGLSSTASQNSAAGIQAAGIQIVTGKGGVGKSTIAGAIASARAADGSRVLAVDSLGSGGLRRVLAEEASEQGPQFNPFEILELTTVDSLTEYVRLTLRVPAALLRPLARLIDFVAMAAPGVREILTIGKICHEARSGQWDYIVVDGPSTGHIVELLNAAQSIATVAPAGPLATETQWMEEILEQNSSVVLVALPEQLSSSETTALAQRIASETEISIAGLVMNRKAPSLSKSSMQEAAALAEGPLKATAELATQRHLAGVEQQAELASEGLPLVVVPDAADPLRAAVGALGGTTWLVGASQ